MSEWNVNNVDCYWILEEEPNEAHEEYVYKCCFENSNGDRLCTLDKPCRFYVAMDKTDEYIHYLLDEIEILEAKRRG